MHQHIRVEEISIQFIQTKILHDVLMRKRYKCIFHNLNHSSVLSIFLECNSHSWIRIFDFTRFDEFLSMTNFNKKSRWLSSHLFSCLDNELYTMITRCTSRNESVQVDFDSGFATLVLIQQRIDSVSIRFDSFSDFIDSNPSDKIYKELLRLSWRCVVNKYIYMHHLYAACARDEKAIFFCGNYRARL
jgi:hypothetical protein